MRRFSRAIPVYFVSVAVVYLVFSVDINYNGTDFTTIRCIAVWEIHENAIGD